MLSTVMILAAILGASGASNEDSQGTNSASEQKYCIEYEKMVGSRISQTECRTKKGWADQGVDLDELLKKERPKR
jgi:uncharacterized protein YjhX (UPF0386 family)